MIASMWNMAHVRILNKHDEKSYYGLNGYMYCVYIFTLMGEVTGLSIRQGIGAVTVLIYILGSCWVIYTFHKDLLTYYTKYLPSYIFYINFVCYYIERSTKINFLQLKKI